MANTLDTAQITPALKHRYTDKKVETLSFKSPTFAAIPKDTDYGGDLYVGAVRSGIPSTISASDTVAFGSGGSASTYLQWQCPWYDFYGSANITGRAIDRANGDANALVKAMAGEFDGVFEAMGQVLGSTIWGNGGGAIGQISSFTNSGASPCVITLADVNTCINFWVGLTLQTSVDDGTASGGVDSAITLATVTAVNITAGTVTVSFTGAGPLVANHYLFVNGCYGSVFPGIPAWIVPPTVTVTSATFNGVNRLTDVTRLSGTNYNGGGSSKLDSLIQLAIQIHRLQGKVDFCPLNHSDYADILKEGQGRVLNATISSYEERISFPAVKLQTPTGELALVPDAFVPTGFAWMLQMDTWLLPSMGKVPKVLSADDLDWLRQGGADAYQLRIGSRATTYCQKPWANGCVEF
jgi:hypothetical protein